MNRKKKKLIRTVIYYGLQTFFLIVFVFSAVYIGSYIINSRNSASSYDKLQQELGQNWATRPIIVNPPTTVPAPTEVTKPSEPSVPTEPVTPTTPTLPAEPMILPEYLSVYNQNNDTVGWIYVPNTKVNYPVMQTPDSPDFYLKHRFDKEWSDWGAIYAREACDVFAPSDNVVLYGHHMKDGSMFSGLDAYKRQAFWQENPYFFFDTLYEHHTYQVFAAFKTSAVANEGYPYHQFNTAATEEEFDEFVSTVKKLSFYDTGITPKYGDRLVTLSTCEYSLIDGRFVVVAYQVS